MSCEILPVCEVRAILERGAVFERLREFDPRWVGSTPLDIHGPGADADIACSAGPDLARFRTALRDTFFAEGAEVADNIHAGEPSVIARLELEGMPVEIFGRARPVETHESYIHWYAEHRLLTLAEDRLRRDVRDAKASGLKTEPAFAAVLGLGGDPFVEILKLASPSDTALYQLIDRAGYLPR
jgi:hypothetical protein